MNVSDLLEERYRLERLLGTGGMSEVWLAEDTRLGRRVAVKVLDRLAGTLDDPALKEARLVARLQHPNIVAVLDTGVQDGRPYIVMEYVNGNSLREVLNERGRLSEGEAVRIGRQIAAALSYSHGKGVLHRDVKPENVLLDEHGVAKLADFGVASAGGQTLAPGQFDDILGTVAYLPPEVFEGHDTDARGEVYSLGLTVFEMVAGRLPFAGAGAAAIAAQRLGQAPAPLRALAADASPALEAVLARCLRMNPADRFQSVAEFAKAMGGISSGRTAVPQPSRPPVARQRTAPPLAPRHPTARIRREPGRLPPPDEGQGTGTLLFVAFVVAAAVVASAVTGVLVVRQRSAGSSAPTPTVAPAVSPTVVPTVKPTSAPSATPTSATATVSPGTATPVRSVTVTNTPGTATASTTRTGTTPSVTPAVTATPTSRP